MHTTGRVFALWSGITDRMWSGLYYGFYLTILMYTDDAYPYFPFITLVVIIGLLCGITMSDDAQNNIDLVYGLVIVPFMALLGIFSYKLIKGPKPR